LRDRLVFLETQLATRQSEAVEEMSGANSDQNQ
jgi:hypothetical protein